jgi:hypothetical protein
MSALFGIFAILLGVAAFMFTNPAGVPIFGLAFGAAGFLRESRGSKRAGIFILLSLGTLISSAGILRSFHFL